MKISEEECQIGELTDSNLAIALRLLRESGYVILESVLPRNLVEELQTAFNQLLMPNMENQQKDSNWNRRGGCHALYGMPFMHPLVIENSLGLQIIEEAMGKDIWTGLKYHFICRCIILEIWCQNFNGAFWYILTNCYYGL